MRLRDPVGLLCTLIALVAPIASAASGHLPSERLTKRLAAAAARLRARGVDSLALVDADYAIQARHEGGRLLWLTEP